MEPKPTPNRGDSAVDPFTTSERIMQTFRMNRELVTFLKGEANARARP